MNRGPSTRGSIIPQTLIASAIIGLLTFTSMVFMPTESQPQTSMSILPAQLTIAESKNFSIDVMVESTEPVNAFAGILKFDENVLAVASINYNTSIADLWTQEPWFVKGDGTITFAGGTTRPGGFTGTGSLLTVTFTGKRAATTPLSLENIRILKHDGLGTDAQLRSSLDALFTIKPIIDSGEIITEAKSDEIMLNTDLNDDTKTTIADISIFMIHLASQNLRSDFNNDKKVTAADLSILLNARQ